jgi:hypothetical protein
MDCCKGVPFEKQEEGSGSERFNDQRVRSFPCPFTLAGQGGFVCTKKKKSNSDSFPNVGNRPQKRVALRMKHNEDKRTFAKVDCLPALSTASAL